MSTQAQSDDLDAYKHWRPDAQQKALEALRQAQNNAWTPFFCPDRACSGHAHVTLKDKGTGKCPSPNGHVWNWVGSAWVCGIPGKPDSGCAAVGTEVDGTWLWEHARVDQRPPRWVDNWQNFVMSGGRGSGKTRTGSEVTHKAANITPNITLIGATSQALRETMIEGRSGILATARPGHRPTWEPSRKRMVWPNGCIAMGFSAEEPDRLRGPECLVAGTMVKTWIGDMPIEYVTVGMKVMTRGGFREVTATGSKMAAVMTRTFHQGTLRGTPDHPVWTENRGWVNLSLVRPYDNLVVWSPTSMKPVDSWSTRPVATPSPTPAGSTRLRSVRSRRATRSTTSTWTGWTTALRTWWRSPRRHTETCTGTPSSHTPALAAAESSASPSVGHGSSAPTARRSSAGSGTVLATASAGRAPSCASSAGEGSRPDEPSSARQLASIAIERVYDLTVDEHHEFFANGILVHNSGFVWADEPAHYPLIDDVWANMEFGLRVKDSYGRDPKVMVTSTPKPTKWMKELVASPITVVRRVSSYLNIQNLTEGYRINVIGKHAGTRLGRQEIMGELIEDVEGALWTYGIINTEDDPPHFERIGIGVDPAGSTNKRADDTGIIVEGYANKQGYVLADLTGKYTPAQWGRKVWEAVREWRADVIVAEKNYGGQMVKHVLETTKPDDLDARVHLVDSRRGKELRAEPVVARYEQKRTWHVGSRGDLTDLEDEMTSWVPGPGSPSPNRVDALVHVDTYLAKGNGPVSIASPADLGPIAGRVARLRSPFGYNN